MESPEKIFSTSGVDSRLSTDRAVYLRHDGGGNLHEWNTPVVNGGNEAGQITDGISDRLTLLALPKHGGREEFLVRFQRGRAIWMVLVYGADNFFDFDRRYIQSFLTSMRICHPGAELQAAHLPSLS